MPRIVIRAGGTREVRCSYTTEKKCLYSDGVDVDANEQRSLPAVMIASLKERLDDIANAIKNEDDPFIEIDVR